ncbi:MAG: hypothetical protein HYZ52_03555 [Candidatus Omnitrophica bacterium]|nr:hypothetical protein [Candidatus Omnitrophota bacterium]
MKKRKAAVWFLPLLLLSVSVHAQGELKGRVVFQGTPPPIETVEVKSDTPVCGAQKKIAKIELGADNGVNNAVVRVIGATGELVPKNGSLDQVNCEFVPHVQVMTAGAKLALTSSDTVLHNAHGFNEDGSTAFNIAVPVVGMEMQKKLDKPGVIRLRCDAGHTWMSGYLIVTDTPFCAVTDRDGNFSIKGVPPGHYELEIWQEWLGKTRRPVDVGEKAGDVRIVLSGTHG